MFTAARIPLGRQFAVIRTDTFDCGAGVCSSTVRPAKKPDAIIFARKSVTAAAFGSIAFTEISPRWLIEMESRWQPGGTDFEKI